MAASHRTSDKWIGRGEDEDFGLEQVTGNAADRYKFRTSPLRNAALQPAFFTTAASRAWKTRSGIT
jgi:cytochrome c peroxidase